MKNLILSLVAGLGLVAACVACSGGKSAETLAQAATLADKMIRADYNHNVEVNAECTGLDVTVRVADSLIHVDEMGPELFDALAALNIKSCEVPELNELVKLLREAKADVTVQLIGTDETSEEFKLTAAQLLRLQAAKLTQLNPSALKTQIVEMAEAFCPNAAAHAGAKEVEVAIVKSFIEYNVVWPDAKAYANREQGWLTLNYFNPLKKMYADLSEACPGLFPMMKELGIDGVRMVYSAPDSERTLKQAFPWRELEKPIEEFPVVKTK